MKKLIHAVIVASLAIMMSGCEDPTINKDFITTDITVARIDLPTAGSGEFTINIMSNMRWFVQSDNSWVSFAPEQGQGSGVTKLLCSENPEKESRSGTFRVIGIDGGGNFKITLAYNVMQPGKGDPVADHLDVSPRTVSDIPYQGIESGVLSVTSNVAWTVEKNASWLTIEQTEGSGSASFKYTAQPNDGGQREGTLTFVPADSAKDLKPVVVTFIQNALGDNPEQYLSVLPLTVADVPYAGVSGSVLTVTSNVAWTVSRSDSWIVLQKSGGEGDGTVGYSVSPNSGAARTGTITFSPSNPSALVEPVVVTISQLKYDGGSPGDPVLGWMEIPKFETTSTTTFVTHYFTKSSREVRNYSLLWDNNELIAYWVAYPMHPSYDGSAGRNEKWKYDPKINSQYQPNLSSSYAGNYSRGHQCASGDRQVSYDANVQTFYYSNMTPQVQTFNGGIWAKLEDKVQDVWTCTDTLYVVTGAALLDTPIKYTTDKSGSKKVAIPSHYYKVLVRSKSGNTGKPLTDLTADQIKCVGFWFEHEPSGGWSSKASPSKSDMKSVAEIERLTGFTFFPAVPESVKQSYNPSDWGM